MKDLADEGIWWKKKLYHSKYKKIRILTNAYWTFFFFKTQYFSRKFCQKKISIFNCDFGHKKLRQDIFQMNFFNLGNIILYTLIYPNQIPLKKHTAEKESTLEELHLERIQLQSGALSNVVCYESR